MARKPRCARLSTLGALAVLAALAAAPGAWAAPVVTNTDDSGAGSLRQAIADAVPGDTIAVPAGTYTLTSGQLVVNKTLTLAGAGTRSTIITAGGASRVMLTGGSPVRLSGLTVTGGRLDITDVVDCQGGAGICNGGDLELSEVAMVGNVANVTANLQNAPGGGAIFNNGNNVTIANSTIAGNQANVTLMNSNLLAAGGAGLFNNGSMVTITNSTISGNALTVNGSCAQLSGCRHGGGGLYNNGDVFTFTNVTLADNSVGGTAPTSAGNFYVDNGPASVFKNSIVSGGVSPSGAANCDKTGANLAISSGGNVESADTCGFSAASDKPNTDPLLAALANNGGPTDTRALQAGSPAIDAAVDCPSATDQRGFARPVGAACDSGAFEFAPPPPPPPAGPPPPPPPPPADPEAGCITLTGSFRGKRLGPAALGQTQRRQRAVFKGATVRQRNGLDRYCARGGGAFGVGYPTAKLLRSLAARLRQAVKGRVVVIVSSSKRYAILGVRPGVSERSAKTKLQRAKKVRAGRSTWYVQRGRSVAQLVAARAGRVQSVGIADARLTRDLRVLKRLLAASEL